MSNKHSLMIQHNKHSDKLNCFKIPTLTSALTRAFLIEATINNKTNVITAMVSLVI